jgi:hypothetical protein
MADLKAKLDEEFEYLGNQLSIPGLKEVVRCALKSERSHLKGLWEKDPSHGPPLMFQMKHGRSLSCIGILQSKWPSPWYKT